MTQVVKTVDELLTELSLAYEDYSVRVTNALFKTNGDYPKAFKKTLKYMDKIFLLEFELSQLTNISVKDLLANHNTQLREWTGEVKLKDTSKGIYLDRRFVIK